MRFCSYSCKASDSDKAQEMACHTENGVYCSVLDRIVNKSAICPVDEERFENYIKDLESES
ncbi:MAG: hypothetical protein ABIF08_03645 [Nanoarchaeota archaeon]